MSIGLVIRAFVCRSTTAAVSLAEKNPVKYFSFANRLISAKNAQVESSLVKAMSTLEYYKSTSGELHQLITLAGGGVGSSATASRAASLSVDWLQGQMQCKRTLHRLDAQWVKYDGLAKALVNIGKANQIPSPALPMVPASGNGPNDLTRNQPVDFITLGVNEHDYASGQYSDCDSSDSRTWE